MVTGAGAASGQSQEPVTSSGSPSMQEPKHLDCLPLLSHVIKRELEGKWSDRDLNQHPYGVLVLMAAVSHIIP